MKVKVFFDLAYPQSEFDSNKFFEYDDSSFHVQDGVLLIFKNSEKHATVAFNKESWIRVTVVDE